MATERLRIAGLNETIRTETEKESVTTLPFDFKITVVSEQ